MPTEDLTFEKELYYLALKYAYYNNMIMWQKWKKWQLKCPKVHKINWDKCARIEDIDLRQSQFLTEKCIKMLKNRGDK